MGNIPARTGQQPLEETLNVIDDFKREALSIVVGMTFYRLLFGVPTTEDSESLSHFIVSSIEFYFN